MKLEDTKATILEKALELFSENGYDAVSVDQIAKAVGIKAPSLYNHFPGKRAIFDAIVEKTARQYEDYTDEINIHVQALSQDLGLFSKISEEHLAEKMRQIFDFSLHNRAIRQFRRMMTIEQFRFTGAFRTVFRAVCGSHDRLSRRNFPLPCEDRRIVRGRSRTVGTHVCGAGAYTARHLRP